jgi:hypothetical protein
MENLQIRGLCSDQLWDHENAFYWFSDTRRIGKLLSHYELYKMIQGLPGDVIECGVYKATSLIRWSTFRAVLESEFSRKILAFDAFGTFPTSQADTQDDASFIERFESAGGEGLTVSETKDIFRFKRIDQNVHFVQGDVHDTVPKWLKNHPEGKVALLHLDMDVYEPTKAVLDQLWDRLVKGGIVVVDDYNAVGGATKAVDEFLTDKNICVQKLGLSHVPCYFVKN